MIKGEMVMTKDNLLILDKWNCKLYDIDDFSKDFKIGIYRNENSISKKYEVHQGTSTGKHYFKTFKEAATCFIELIKNDPKYIPDIMRLTALMSEEA